VRRRGIDLTLGDGTGGRIHGVESERLGAAEVWAEPSLVQWNRDSHEVISFSVGVS
jgi:hypothetical protein